MIFAAHLEVHLWPVFWLVVVWLFTSQVLLTLLLQAHSRSLVAWSVGVLGVSAIFLHRPNALLRFLQVVLPMAGAGSVTYWLLSSPIAPPVTGLMDAANMRLGIAAGGTLLLSTPRLLATFTELRFPLWGEAGVLDHLARSRALGNALYFTTMGRAYIHERFHASPSELLQIVRRRPPSVAQGS